MAYIITMIALILAGIFALLVKVWTGFMYFVLALLLALSLFWAVWKIVKYFTEFKKTLEEKFGFYKAQIVNAGGISIDQFNKNEAAYRKEYNKKCLKDKVLYWLLIAFCFALASSFLLAIILM